MIVYIDESQIPVHTIPEKKLWAAVLLQAFLDMEGLAFGNRGAVDTNRNQAMGWIKSDRTDYIGSFLYVCEVLDLDPGYVRSRFKTMKQQIKRKEKIPKGLKARIKAFDTAKLSDMTCLQIASYFNTSKSLVYNIVSDLGIKYKQIRPGSGNKRKKLVDK
uniref:Uncharacterized protein n=1 Tax=viral metagenome TaxID=1070528 RepID=A0A6M3XVF8_9ZZZZ